MTGAVPPPPPPPDNYVVLGRDGRKHPVRLETLRAWAADGSITAAHQVYSDATGRWALAGELPELRDVLQRSSAGKAEPKKMSGCGCVLIGGAILLLIGILAGSGDKSDRSRASSAPASAPPVTQIGRGDRSSHMNQLVAQLAPLFISWEEVGPASVHVQLSPGAWNALSRDQQRQLMDDLATKQIVRDIGATIHFRVRSTSVGTIGPGWSGEYKFRRPSE